MSFRSRNRVKTKKRSSPKLEEFLSLKSREDKKKVFTAIWDKFDRIGILGQISYVQPALKPRWGNAESRWRDAKSLWGDASPRVKIAIFAAKSQKSPVGWGLCPPAPSVVRTHEFQSVVQ